MAPQRPHSGPYTYSGFNSVNFCSEDLQAKGKGGENIWMERGGKPHLQKWISQTSCESLSGRKPRTSKPEWITTYSILWSTLAKGTDIDQKHCQTSSKFSIYCVKSQVILNNFFLMTMPRNPNWGKRGSRIEFHITHYMDETGPHKGHMLNWILDWMTTGKWKQPSESMWEKQVLGMTEPPKGVITVHWRPIHYEEILSAFPLTLYFKICFSNTWWEIWSLNPKLQQAAACPPLSFPPSPDSFALFPRQLIYMTFFFFYHCPWHYIQWFSQLLCKETFVRIV